MASNYPTSFDNHSTGHADGVGERIQAATINDLGDAVNKIERELGINPSGIYSDVLTRLNQPVIIAVSNLGTSIRTILDSTFSGPPAVGSFAGITYHSTVNAYNLVWRAGTGVWIHLRRGVHGRDYGAIFDRTADDTTALQAALSETTSSPFQTRMQRVWLPAGEAIVGATLVPPSVGGAIFGGEGSNASVLYLKNAIDLPVYSSASLPPAIRHTRDLQITAVQKAGHATNFPLFDDSGNDVGTVSSLYVLNAPGDGIWDKGVGAAAAPSADVRWYYILTDSNAGYGMVLDSANDHTILSSQFMRSGKSGLWIRGNPARAWAKNDVQFFRSEANLEFGIKTERSAATFISNGYSDNEASVYVGDDSYLNVVEKMTVIGNIQGSAVTKHMGVIYNMDRWTIVRNVDGAVFPFDDAIGHHLPGSCVLDPYEERNDSTAWTVAGAGAVTKNYSLDGMRYLRWFGKRPTRISTTAVGTANYAYKTVNCAAGDSFDFEFYWYGGNGGVGDVVIRVVDDASPGVDLYNSGTLVGRSLAFGDWGEERHYFTFRVPTGVSKLRFVVQPAHTGTASCVYAGRCDAIRSTTVTNPGMQSTTGFAYAGGIASGWSLLTGTGTASEETTIKKFPGSSTQKIVCSAAQSHYLSQNVTLDSSRWYELRGWVYVPSGTPPQYAVIGLGTNLTADYVHRLPSFTNDQWVGVSAIVKSDSSHNKLIFGLMAQGTAYFQQVQLTPLRERYEQWWRHTSEELDLGGVLTTSYLFTPTIDEVLRRVVVTYTGAGTGTVNVGVPGDAARFGTLGSAASQWDQKEITLTRSDLRSINPQTAGALPLQISTPGGGSGKAFVTIEGGTI